MKKTILFFIAILYGVSVAGQLVGDGLTAATAYCGTITNAQTWTIAYNSGTIYVGQTGNSDLTITTGGSLSIQAGVTVKFCTTASDLIITNNGVLTAIGSGASNITFTKNDQPSWGHISFQNMTPGFTTQSTLDYCIIEFGRKNSTPSNIEAYGGAIQTSYTYLSISHSTIRNNYAGWGGGIFVNQNASPSISNCSVYGNSAANAGGGIYCWSSVNSVITNCLIFNNSSGSVGGGGVFLGDNCGNVRIINCTISNNSSSDPVKGQNIQFHYTIPGRIKVINTIVWGSSNSIYHIGFSPNIGDFTNCAIQDVSTPAATFTNCIDLSGNNSDATGPNFNATDGTNWSIKFISPCRDAGIYSGAPSTDILGKFRVGLPDIGAYEVQYSNWTGATSTSWTTQSNWEASVDPASGSGDVIIPSNSGHIYPVATPAPDFTIGSGKVMILRPGAEATLGSLTNSGTLRLEEDVTGISSLIFSSYSGNSADIQLFLPGGGTQGTYKWHYISSPVTTLSASIFSAVTLDIARYDESLITNDQNNGWVAYDGWIYLPAPGHLGGTGFSTLNVGQGYNHYLSSNHTYTISGTFNTNDVTIPLAYNSINSTPDYRNAQGFNLLGNPFPSCLDWGQIAGGLNSSISQAIYFNKMGGFASWVNGVGTNGGTGTIPPMQGFFVKTYAKSTSVLLPASARVHNVAQIRYKKGLEIIPLIRLKIEDPLNSDDAVVRFDDKATTAVDNAFDAYKFSKTGSSVDIWTTTGGADLSVNGLPFPNPGVEIPVSIYSNAAGNLKITGTQIDGLDNYSITLTDNVNNITIDLKTNPVLSFNAPGGIVADRFVLKVGTITTAVPETIIRDKSFNIYSSNGMLNIQTLNDTWNGKSGGIKILDMTGRVVTTEDDVEFSKDNLLQVPVRVATGIYMVEIRSGVMRFVGKVVIR